MKRAPGASRPNVRFGWEELYRLVLLRKEERPRGSGTTELFAGGRTGIARRFGASAVDTMLAAADGEPSIFIGEVADLVYHLTVLMAAVGVSPAQLEELLRERHEVWEKRKSRAAAPKRATKRARPASGKRSARPKGKPAPKTKALRRRGR